MYIEIDNPAVRRLKVDGEYIDFNGDGRARVRADLGEKVADRYAAVSIVDRESDDDDDIEARAAEELEAADDEA